MKYTPMTITFPFILAFLLTGSVGAAQVNKEKELQRTWEGSWVFAPASNAAGSEKLNVSDLAHYPGKNRPKPQAVILYAHGCDGLSRISSTTGRFLARAGSLVVEPNSFARKYKPVSCNPKKHVGGLQRIVIVWRHNELHYAHKKLMTFKPLRNLPLVLMGQSQGAIAVATIKNLPAAGRIIESWTCHSGWYEYRGLVAPAGQPVLSLVGADDPWFRAPFLHGNCGSYMHGPKQHSIVYKPPNYLAHKHWLSFDSGVQKTILEFLDKVISH